SAPWPTLSPATKPCDTPPRRPRKPWGTTASAAARMTSTGSPKAAVDLLAGIAAQLRLGSDPLQLGAHERGADRLDPAPPAERCDEARGCLGIDRIEGKDKVGDQTIAFAAVGVEPMRCAGERHVKRADTVGVSQREVGMPRQRLDVFEHGRMQRLRLDREPLVDDEVV